MNDRHNVVLGEENKKRVFPEEKLPKINVSFGVKSHKIFHWL